MNQARKSISLLPTTIITSAERERKATYPLANSSRKKYRRWPLVLRFTKGAIHGAIFTPVFLHTLLTAVVVYISKNITATVDLPNSIIPSLSIVVGLMLVFRNQTAYQRFWEGRLHLNVVTTSVRSLTRSFLVLSPPPTSARRGSTTEVDNLGSSANPPTLKRTFSRSMPNIQGAIEDADQDEREDEEARTLEAVRILIAMMYTIKNHLRANWGVALSPGTCITSEGQVATASEYMELLPDGLRGYEHRGLSLTLELATFVESFISYGVEKNWFNASAAASMHGSLDNLTKAYGDMEVIRLTPIPVAHLIHHQQVLAIYCTFLSFAMAAEMGWWAVPIVAFVSFTLYGVEGIAQTFEDPFGTAKIDIKMNDIFEDTRREAEVMIDVWRTQNHGRKSSGTGTRKCNMFVPRAHNTSSTRSSSTLTDDSREGHSNSNSNSNSSPSPKAGQSVRFADFRQFERADTLFYDTPPQMKHIDVLDGEQGEASGARRVTWGSVVGADDHGVWETESLLETV
jgi:putative membrane protein